VPALLGVPFDENSSYRRGAAKGPAAIRAALRCDSTNLWTENGQDLGALATLEDAGDVDCASGSDAFVEIERRVAALLASNARPLLLGGDHSITYPVFRAFAKKYPQLTILHFDAHPDLYDAFHGSRVSHACPFARIMEQRLARRLVQIGVRTMNGHQREQARRFGVEVIEMRKWARTARLRLAGPLYISFDMDALDPGCAPGVSHPEPGGMSTREALRVIQSLRAGIVGADVVELNPDRDVNGITAMAAAKLVKEIAARMR